MQVNNSRPSFGMAVLKPNLSGMTVAEIAGIRKAMPRLEKIAADVDIRISKSCRKDRMCFENAETTMITRPCYNLEFSAPGNFITRLFKSKYNHLSENTMNAHLDGDEMIIKAAIKGKEKYTKSSGLDIKNETKQLKKAMRMKTGANTGKTLI